MERALLNLRLDDGPVLSRVLPLVGEAFASDKAVSYRVEDGDDGLLRVVFFHGYRIANTSSIDPYLGRARRPLGDFRPFAPRQVDRRVRLPYQQTPGKVAGRPIVGQLFPTLGLDGLDLMRVVVCEGSTPLAYLGCFRERPFDASEARRLQRLVPMLETRLALDLRLGRATLAQAALEAALESFVTPAFVVKALPGAVRVELANELGRAALARDRAGMVRRLEAAVGSGDASAFAVRPLEGVGGSRYVLAIGRPPHTPLERCLARARLEWGLTPRETEALRHLATGRPNKLMADDLGCSIKTVEIHVGHLTRKAGAANRAALVARFWRLA